MDTKEGVSVPGLPTRDCAKSYNSIVHRRTTIDSIHVTAKVLFERLCFRIGHIWARSQLSPCTHNPDRSNTNYFSIFVIFLASLGSAPASFIRRHGNALIFNRSLCCALNAVSAVVKSPAHTRCQPVGDQSTEPR